MNPSENEITIDQIVESFSARLENGEHPSIEEYKQKHPQLADKIEGILPALVALERIEHSSGRRLAVDDSIPKILGDYQIVQEIGRGGMGIVFEARHVTMHRRVALKVLPKSSADKANYLNRFLTEARSAGQLHHTNIVPVFEVGYAEDLHFYAMQFIHGDNLDRVIEDVRVLREQNPESDSPSGARQVRQAASKRPELSQSLALELIHDGAAVSRTGAAESGLNSGEEWMLNSGLNDQPADDRIRGQLRPESLNSPSVSNAQMQNATNVKGLSETVFRTQNSSAVIRNRNAYHQRVAAVGIQVAHALEYAHNHGVLHRDVKPANLILDTDGNVWVTDFGLAKLNSDDLTQTGDIIGTLRYMAPERFAGDADRRSDIYSLGLTLYELVTLKCAFENDRGTLVKDVASSSSVISPCKIDESIPADLETIILKAIEPQPERRYQTAFDLAEDLQLYLSDRPIKARRASVLEKCWRICRRNPVAASLTFCIAALLILVAAGSLQYANTQIAARKESQEFATKETRLRKQLQQNLFDSKMEQARMRRYSHRLGQRFESLAAIRQATELLPQLELMGDEQDEAKLLLRNEAIAAMALTDVNERWTHAPETAWALRRSFAFDHANQIFAEANETGRIRIVRSSDSQVLSEIPAPIEGTPSYGLRFSPNGRFLQAVYLKSGAPRHKQTTLIWDLESLDEPVIEKIGVEDFVFSADSEHVAIATKTKVEIYNIQNPEKNVVEVVPDFSIEEGGIRQIVFSQSSDRIAISQASNGLVEFWDLSDEPKKIRQLETEENVFSMDWASDRNIFVVGSSRGRLYYWRGDLDAEPQILSLHQNTIIHIYIHPTRDLIASEAWDRTVRFTDLLSGEEVLLLENYTLLHTGFSQDGCLAFSNQDYRNYGVWEVSCPLLDVYTHPQGSGKGWRPRFHPTYPQLVAISLIERIEFWDTAEKKIVYTLADVHARDFRFSMDGSQMYVTGDSGLQRWEVNVAQAADGQMQIQLAGAEALVTEKANRLVLSSDGERIIIGVGSRARMVSATDGSLITQFGRHAGLSTFDVTADDRFLVTGTWKGRGIKVWDLDSGEEVNEFIVKTRSVVPAAHPINPDVFVTVLGGIRFGRIDQQSDPIPIEHPILSHPSSVVFSRDGQSLVAKNGSYELVLLDPVSGCPLATFQSDGLSRVLGFEFSPDAQQLAVACFDNLQIVDINNVRIELTKLGLDWE